MFAIATDYKQWLWQTADADKVEIISMLASLTVWLSNTTL